MTGWIGNQRKNRNHLVYGIVKIIQNTVKSPDDLKRFVIQTPVKDQLVWKTRKDSYKDIKIDNNPGLML